MSAMHEFMLATADAWGQYIKAGGVVDKKTGHLRHLTYTGDALTPIVIDSEPGEQINEAGVVSRGRRIDIADDITWSPSAINELRALCTGQIARAKSSIDTGVDLSKIRGISDLKNKLRGDEGDRYLRALTPASADDAPSLFMVSELIHNLEEVVRVERVMPWARQILPMKMLNAPGADSYQFSVLDEYGDAMWTSNFDGAPPMVGQNRKLVRRPLEYLWMGAQWGLREMMQWQQARANGIRLPDFASERPRIAREAILRMENMWLFFGGPKESGILGLLQADNKIPTNNSAHWTTLSAADVVKLITDQITAINSEGVEVPDTILLPIAFYNYLGTTQWPNTDKMILGVLMEALRPLGIREIVAVPELTFRAALETKLLQKKYSAADAQRYAGGKSGKDCMVVMSRRPEKVAGIVSQDVKMLAPEFRPAMTSVTMILGSGGCEVRFPNAHRIVTFDAP